MNSRFADDIIIADMYELVMNRGGQIHAKHTFLQSSLPPNYASNTVIGGQ